MSKPEQREPAQKGGDKMASLAFFFVFPPTSLLSLLLHIAENKTITEVRKQNQLANGMSTSSL